MEASQGIASVPADVIVESILSRLDVSDLVRLRLVSKSFRELVDDEFIWKRRLAGKEEARQEGCDVK